MDDMDISTYDFFEKESERVANLVKEQNKEVLKQALAQQRDLERAIRFKSEIISKRENIRKQLIDFNNAHVDEDSQKTFNNNGEKESLEYQEALLSHYYERLKSNADSLQEELDRQALIMEQLSKTLHELKEKKMLIEDLDKQVKEDKNCPEFAIKKLLFSTINKIMNVSYKNDGNIIQGVYLKGTSTFTVSKFIRKDADRPEAFDELMQEALVSYRSKQPSQQSQISEDTCS